MQNAARSGAAFHRVRTDQRARTRIATLAKEIHDYYWNFSVDPRLLELRNLIEVAGLIVSCASQRKESRGLHAITDYPRKLKVARDSRVRRIAN